MKTTLPDRSLVIKEKLDNIIKEILYVGKSKIAMIILFGSYARGDWVEDIEKIGDISYYKYQSDFDLLLILKNGEYAGYPAINLQHKIENRLGKKFSLDETPPITLILEPIKLVNRQLEKGQYFFSDIKKEGILLYNSGKFILSEAKELSWQERRPIAEKDYKYWFKKAKDFLLLAHLCLDIEQLNNATFMLHQATESFYNAILLVFTGYKAKSHDILGLGDRARSHHYDIYKIFPHETPEQEECFTLLRNAYVDARYDQDYTINKEQLLYLINRVEELKIVTEKICLERINKIEVYSNDLKNWI
ncbi:MAG: HEPN domain-containing protein [Rickettsia endosymbiont of Sergentomyia squamirostris]|uniref:HEPN domain-containing protein n=1 Tax=Candidatus Tisiphia endosymbiont of Sergentomyia squamirostris TaxID=3113639 RepID=A0AAT9G8A9_9RICK